MEDHYFCEICSRFVDVTILSEEQIQCKNCNCSCVEQVDPELIIDVDIETKEENGCIEMSLYDGCITIIKNERDQISISMNLTNKSVDRSLISKIMNMLNPRFYFDLDGTLQNKQIHPRFSNQIRDAFYRLFPAMVPKSAVSVVMALPSREPTETDKENECSVCLSALDSGEIVELPCKHTFHRTCILLSIANRDRCPLCLREIMESSNHHELELENVDLD